MTNIDEELWRQKGSTLSDKTARQEYNLTQEEIIEGIEEGKLHFRISSMHGNPWYRLLRNEVEEYVKEKHGEVYLQENKCKTELRKIDKELKALKAQTKSLEIRRNEILSIIGSD